jgi:hypothetical protein
MNLCKDCKHFEPIEVQQFTKVPKGSGHCGRWYEGYHVDAMQPNEAWVENDEGWGNVVGPEFGCVLFETKDSAE